MTNLAHALRRIEIALEKAAGSVEAPRARFGPKIVGRGVKWRDGGGAKGSATPTTGLSRTELRLIERVEDPVRELACDHHEDGLDVHDATGSTL